MCESPVTFDMLSRHIKNKTDTSRKYPAKVFVRRSILHLRTIYRSTIIDGNLTSSLISDNEGDSFDLPAFLYKMHRPTVSESAVNLMCKKHETHSRGTTGKEIVIPPYQSLVLS